MARTRTRSLAANRGTYILRDYDKWGGVSTLVNSQGSASVPLTETMTDVADGDFKTPNGASKTEVRRVGGTANGNNVQVFPTLTRVWSVDQYRLTGTGYNPPTWPASTFPTDSELATKAAGSSSPGKPSVSLPVSIGELRELPNMLKNLLGSDALQEAFSLQRKSYRIQRPKRLSRRRPYSQSNSIAEWEFGWLPLIRDIVNLFSIPKYVDDRVDRIRANAGVLVEHRTVHSHNAEWPIATSYPFSTVTGLNVLTSIKGEFIQEARATVVWTPRSTSYTTSDPDLRRRVLGDALGLSPTQLVYNAWQLLPWSWLADWFGNTGDFLLSRAGTLDYSSDITISKKSWVIARHTVTSKPAWLGITPFHVQRHNWDRVTHVNPLWVPIKPSPQLLTGKQLLILLGIANNMRSRYGIN